MSADVARIKADKDIFDRIGDRFAHPVKLLPATRERCVLYCRSITIEDTSSSSVR